MAKILKYFLLMTVVLLLANCKSTNTVTTKTKIVQDSVIRDQTKVITLPTHHTTIIKTPCKNDSLIIADQYYQIGKLKVTIKNLNGQLSIETNTDSIISSKVTEILKHTEKEKVYLEKTTLKNVIPKWIWYILGFVAIYIAYRVARIYIPFLKILPY